MYILRVYCSRTFLLGKIEPLPPLALEIHLRLCLFVGQSATVTEKPQTH
jgi:hypothetical protein